MTPEEIEEAIDGAIDAFEAWKLPLSAAQDKAFAEWLMDTDAPSYARSYLATMGKSNCGLVVRKFLRLVGVTDPEVVQPYAKRDGKAISDIGVLGVRYHAWVTTAAGLSQFPPRGDVFGIAVGNPHVGIAMGTNAPRGTLYSLNGGQAKKNVPGGGSVVAVREHELIAPEKGMPFLRDLPDPDLLVPGGRERALYGRIDTRKLIAGAVT